MLKFQTFSKPNLIKEVFGVNQGRIPRHHATRQIGQIRIIVGSSIDIRLNYSCPDHLAKREYACDVALYRLGYQNAQVNQWFPVHVEGGDVVQEQMWKSITKLLQLEEDSCQRLSASLSDHNNVGNMELRVIRNSSIPCEYDLPPFCA